MTERDKRNKLGEYCELTGCDECKLKNGGWKIPITRNGCLDILMSPEKDIDRALALISVPADTVPVDQLTGVNRCVACGEIIPEGALVCPSCEMGKPLENVARALDSKPDYWARVCEKQREQTEKGLSKYGMTLEDNTRLRVSERLNHLEEELIDALMYIEHLKEILS